MSFLKSIHLLAQADDFGAAPPEGGIGSTIVGLIIIILLIGGLWKTFAKAGEPGWAAIVPFYNIFVLLKVVGRPGWWFILMLIPFVNFIIAIIVYIDLAKSFGKGVGYGLGLVFLPFIFIPVLGFGSAQYVGPAAAQ